MFWLEVNRKLWHNKGQISYGLAHQLILFLESSLVLDLLLLAYKCCLQLWIILFPKTVETFPKNLNELGNNHFGLLRVVIFNIKVIFCFTVWFLFLDLDKEFELFTLLLTVQWLNYEVFDHAQVQLEDLNVDLFVLKHRHDSWHDFGEGEIVLGCARFRRPRGGDDLD